VNKFLFITHLTPRAKRSSLRESLILLQQKALEAQTYTNWKSLIIGEEEKKEGRFFELRIDPELGKVERRKPLSQLYERPDVKSYLADADYVIKLDDDDLISPVLLEKLKNFSGDLYYDESHTFYDVTSGQLTQQVRPWIASTCVHKVSHAASKLNDGEIENFFLNSLLYSDHSKTWHKYYTGKKIMKADPAHPVYLRILSPTSITSGTKKFPLQTMRDIDFQKYYEYLNSFGDWKGFTVTGFNKYMHDLESAWTTFAGEPQKPIPSKNMLNRFLVSIKNKLTR
jgi:hypothetical protein